MDIFSKIKDIVSVIFSISLILFITSFCIVDLVQTKRKQDKARRDREKRKYDKQRGG